jgi:hypothetical protein
MSNNKTNPPTARLYFIKGDGKTSYFAPIGALWPNKDRKGYSIQLDVPVHLTKDDRLAIRDIVEEGSTSKKT